MFGPSSYLIAIQPDNIILVRRARQPTKSSLGLTLQARLQMNNLLSIMHHIKNAPYEENKTMHHMKQIEQ
jgi:hypothetical protein